MHIYTLVITPGRRRGAVKRAEALLDRAAAGYCDYWRTGGWFSNRLGAVERPEIKAWYAAEAERYERFEAERPVESLSDVEYELRRLIWIEQEAPYGRVLGRLKAEAQIDLIRLTSQLPSPLPETMVPTALVTPDARWDIIPVGWPEGDPRWSRRVNATIDHFRGGHCVVTADCHC